MASFKNNGIVKKKGLGTELRGALMTGVSYMLPLVIAGAVIMGISRIGASFYGIVDIWDSVHALSDNGIIRLLNSLDQIGAIGLSLMLPIIAGYIAYGIANKPALAPGLIAGALSQQLGSGFLGALVAGLLAGYIVRYMVKYIKLPGAFASITPIFLIPFGATLSCCLIVIYIIGEPLSSLNQGLENSLLEMSGTNKILLAAIIGGMVGFDLGGPVNKAAITSSLALLASGIYDPNTAAQVAIVVPPIGMGIAIFIWRDRFQGALQEAGKSSLLMGLVGVSEGAIPFILAKPQLIIVNVIGSAVAAALAVGLGAVNKAPISGFYGWLAVEGWQVYVLSIGVGAIIIGVVAGLLVKPETQTVSSSS